MYIHESIYRTRRNFRGVLYFADFVGKFDPRNYYALLYFITHEIFKIRTKTKKPRKFITSKITTRTVLEKLARSIYLAVYCRAVNLTRLLSMMTDILLTDS